MTRVALALTLLLASSASAQDAGVDAALDPATAAFQRAIDTDPWTASGSEESTDPLAGADRAALAEVTDDPDVDEVEAPVPIRHGEILEAISGVSEASHAIAITLDGGVAVVSETIVLASVARHRAEAMLRLAVPEGAALVSLHVENAGGAREGVVADAGAPQSAYDDALLVRSTTPSPRPVAHARLTTENGGTHLVVRAAPVAPDAGGELTVRVTWAIVAPVHGGVARLTLPARGNDPRAARPTIALSAVDVVEPRIDGAGYERGPIDVRTETPIEISALVPLTHGPRVEGALVPCGSGRCAVLRATGGRPRPSAAPITIAIDASPSTTIGARGRIADVVRVALALLPAATEVRVVAFAARTEELGHGRPADVDLARVRTAIELPLGSATRWSALWAAIAPTARAGDRVLIVGDGGLTTGAMETLAWNDARARGVVVSAIDVANRSPTLALASEVSSSGGIAVEAGLAADRAAAGRGDEALAESLSRALVDALSPVEARTEGARASLGTLRTGESVFFVAPAGRAEITMGAQHASARPVDAARAAVLSALASSTRALIAVEAADLDASAGACAPDGSPRARATARAGSIVGHGLRIAPAHRRSCNGAAATAATSAAATASLPARVLRDQLRRRVIPPARRCFRDDRAGRTRMHRAVTFDLVLADREVVDASIEGDIPDALRTCLLGAFDGVDVPSFDGTLRVRWPLHTDAVLPPPSIELAPDVAREVRAIAGEAPLPTSPSGM